MSRSGHLDQFEDEAEREQPVGRVVILPIVFAAVASFIVTVYLVIRSPMHLA